MKPVFNGEKKTDKKNLDSDNKEKEIEKKKTSIYLFIYLNLI